MTTTYLLTLMSKFIKKQCTFKKLELLSLTNENFEKKLVMV
jgi:hypothetical protein